MEAQIRPLASEDIEDVVRLSLLAWAPVFDSFRQVLGFEIYTLLFPDWRKSQSEAVESVCRDEQNIVWIVEVDDRAAGFVACKLDQADRIGEIYMIAVHPTYQNQGLGTQLTEFALDNMCDMGMKLAVVSTGGDPGHAPARRTYEKAGYTALPQVNYYRAL